MQLVDRKYSFSAPFKRAMKKDFDSEFLEKIKEIYQPLQLSSDDFDLVLTELLEVAERKYPSNDLFEAKLRFLSLRKYVSHK